MRHFISHHQHKGRSIDDALRREGWLFRHKRVDVALFDHYVNRTNPEKGRGLIKSYHEDGATILTYPHGATGAWWMDNDNYVPDERISANLVIGEGHKYIDSITQPQLEHHIIGWSYCPIKAFQKPNKVKRILFAPIHASINGNELREECIDTNARVYQALLALPRDYTIIVRHLNPLDTIGLRYNSRIRFKWTKPDGSYQEIDEVDLVIGEGTFMYLSVARGKPTIGMNQYIPIRPNGSDKSFKLNNWDKYGDYMAYPIDFDDGPFVDLIEKAASAEQSKWKQLFIGNKMQQQDLSNLLTDLRKKDLSNRN